MESQPLSTRIVSFYRFHSLPKEQVEPTADVLKSAAASVSVYGLVILGEEGINATICGSDSGIDTFLSRVCEHFSLSRLEAKESRAPKAPFKRFTVKIRDEIVTLGQPGVVPDPDKKDFHLSPEEWHRTLIEEDVVVLDTRNWYETQIGKFKNALDPKIEEFSEFPAYLEKSGIPKDKKVLIYCTGGIRCEKAILEMHRQGFNQTYQLDGGILAYLEKFPNAQFEGECFVFDHRVAVDQALSPTQNYGMCPHCGQPSGQKISCARCETEAYVCQLCLEKEAKYSTCSKNCAYHYALNPTKKGLRQFRDAKIKPAKFRA